jgi:hypothetical protein
MAGFLGQHFEIVNAIDEPSFVFGRINREPHALRCWQPRPKRHLDVAAVIFE